MLQWFVDKYLKQYIDELVDQRFNAKVYEKYYEGRQKELRKRINEIRRGLHSQTQGISQEAPSKLQSSSRVPTRSAESKPQESPTAAAMKAKLLGIKK
jgi:hypothetical protein